MDRFFYTAAFLSAVCFSQAACSRCESKLEQSAGTDLTAPPSGPLVTCPVCGLTFHQSESVGDVSVRGKRYYFFLKDHMKAFKETPGTFLNEESSTKPAER